jgi:lambda family phage portal protein
MLSKLFPKLAAKRAYWKNIHDHYAGGYDGAKDSRHRQGHWYRGVSPVDEDSQIGAGDRNRLRLECRDLQRNNAIVCGILERFADNVVGTGITPQAKTSDKAWNAQAEAWWREWAKVSDSRQRLTMRELQRLAVISRLTDGESGFILTTNGQLQPIEAERICTPAGEGQNLSIVDGVQLSKTGIPTRYYVAPRDERGYVKADMARGIARGDFIHCRRMIRFDQVRGIPDLAPVINMLRDFGELQGATVNKAKLDAYNGWAVTTEAGPGAIGALGPRDVTPSNNESTMKSEGFDMGMIHYLKTGEKMESLASNTPNGQYVNFTQLILHIIGSALGIPYQFLLLDFSNGSFSSSRAGMIQTYQTFKNWQTWLSESFMRRTWNWRIAKAIKEGQLPPAPVDDMGRSEWHKVEWAYPDYQWIDPQKEAIGNMYDVALGVSTITDITQKRGKDAHDIFKKKAADFVAAGEMVKEVNEQLDALGLDDRITIDHITQAKVPPGAAIKSDQEMQQQEQPSNE